MVDRYPLTTAVSSRCAKPSLTLGHPRPRRAALIALAVANTRNTATPSLSE